MITTPNANAILKLFFGQQNQITGTNKCYLGLSTSKPNADGSNFTEPDQDSTGYKRAQININVEGAMQYTNMMSVPSEGAIANEKEITFPEAKQAYSVTHFGVFGQKEVGTGIPLYTHALTNEDGTSDQTVDVDVNEVLLFRKGALSLEFVQD